MKISRTPIAPEKLIGKAIITKTEVNPQHDQSCKIIHCVAIIENDDTGETYVKVFPNRMAAHDHRETEYAWSEEIHTRKIGVEDLVWITQEYKGVVIIRNSDETTWTLRKFAR